MITLRNVLRLNSISSGVTGLLLTIVPGIFSNLFEVSSTSPFFWTGIFLVTFATAVGVVSIGKHLQRSSVMAITLADSLWVVGSIVLLILPIGISVIGKVLIFGVAAWVTLMAILQYKGINESHPEQSFRQS